MANLKLPSLIVFALTSVLVALPAQEEAPTDGNDESALISAYQREFVFLNNEIQSLERRLEEVEVDGTARVRASRRRLQQLEGELLEISRNVDRRSEELRILEDESADARDAGDTLQNIVTQGTNRLRENGRPTWRESGTVALPEDLPEGDRLALELGYIFGESFDLLAELGTIRTVSEPFFLEGGERVDGSITFVGEVAALGVADAAAGTLAPAGGGRLRLVDTATAETARALQAGPGGTDMLPIYLYESLDTLVETDRGSGLMETIEGAGLIGLVIIGIGFVSIVLIVMRSILLSSVGTARVELVDHAATALKERDFDRAIAAIATAKGAAKRVLTATIEGLRADPEAIEDVIAESVLNEQPRIDRFRSAISVFAAVAPLLGLLGTVTGMIATFDIITQFGTGDPGLLSGGISEALITTEFGLIVAIPALLIGNLLSSWADRITSTLEISALRMVNALSGVQG